MYMKIPNNKNIVHIFQPADNFRIASAVNNKEKYDLLLKFPMDDLSPTGKFISALLGHFMCITTNKKNWHILKNIENEAIGGYKYSIKEKCFCIDVLAIRNGQKQQTNYGALKAVGKDIKNMLKGDNINHVVCMVYKDEPKLVNMYKKLGMNITSEKPDMHIMCANKKHFISMLDKYC